MDKTSYLLPYNCQKAGWWLAGFSLLFFAIFIILALFDQERVVEFLDWMREPIIWITYGIPFIALVLICLSREKNEDEYISSLRARSVVPVVIIGFLASMISNVYVQIGGYLYDVSHVGSFMMVARWFTSPLVLALVFLLIFKGTLFINWLKTRNS